MLNKPIIIPPQKMSPLFETHIRSLASFFLEDSVGENLRSLGMGWTVCKETYYLHNLLPASANIAFVVSGEKHIHHDTHIERCPRGGLTLFPAGVPVCMSNVSLIENNGKEKSDKEDNQNHENLGYVALCVSFPQEVISTVSHLFHNNNTLNLLSTSSPSASSSSTSSACESSPTISSHQECSLQEFSSDDFLLAVLESLALMCHSLSKNTHGSSTQVFATRMLENLLLLIASQSFGTIMLHGVMGVDSLSLRLRELFRKELSYPWKMSDVASHLHMTERTLRRHLEKSGNGLRELLRSERLHAGLVLLQQTSESVESIALDCGYSSASRFSRRFQDLFGVLPREMRKARGDWGGTLSV